MTTTMGWGGGEDEIDDLGESLKRWVNGSQTLKGIIESRLAFDICFGNTISLSGDSELSTSKDT